MKIGDKYKCIKQINNLFGWTLFKKDEIYEILSFDEDYVVLNHILYANEYVEHNYKFLDKNFIKIE
jgi:hypothetical protein